MQTEGRKTRPKGGRVDELLAAQAQFCKHGRPSCNGYKYADRLRGWGDNITIPGIEQRFSTYRDRDRDLRRHQELLLASRRSRVHIFRIFFSYGSCFRFFSHDQTLARSFSPSLIANLTGTVLASRAAETVRRVRARARSISFLLFSLFRSISFPSRLRSGVGEIVFCKSGPKDVVRGESSSTSRLGDFWKCVTYTDCMHSGMPCNPP